MTLRRFRSILGKQSHRRGPRKSLLHRSHARKMLTEQLEDRRLLAGPELIAIRPDAGALLRDGDTLNVAPREFNLLFKGGADLKESTINSNTVRLVRSGGDGSFGDSNDVSVALGYVGLAEPGSTDPEELQRIVFRTASTASHNATDDAYAFPDDTYRIEIMGAGGAALTNTGGEAFNDGVDYALQFRLDRGPQVVGVVPQPVQRVGASLNQQSNKIVVYFDNQLLDKNDAEDPRFYRLIDTATTIDRGDDVTLIPQTAVYEASNQSVTLTFESDLPEGTFRLDVGYSADGTSANNGAVQVGSLFPSVSGSVASGYVVNSYLGDESGRNDDASDVDAFALRVETGTTVNVRVEPKPGLAVKVTLLDASGVMVGAPVTGADGAVVLLSQPVTAGNYTVKVESDGGTGSYVLQTSLAGGTLSINDDNSDVTKATQLGVLGAAGITLTSAIQPQSVPLPPYPGGNDEPGHRQIQRESHIGSTGTALTTPSAIITRGYYFPSTIGSDTSGNAYPNLITEEEKRIVRGIYDVLAEVSGYEFIETTNSGGGGTMIGKGDLRALNPLMGPDAGVGGLGGAGAVVLNGDLFNQANRYYGDGFTSTMMHEILHSLGLGHAYELPAAMSGVGLPNDVTPGDNDVVHLQRIVPPSSTDVDLFKFVLEESGKWSAETVAERRSSPSQLNTLLKLYRQNDADPNQYDLVAQNDRYFGNDSFLELDLGPGTYFVGVTSTGNDTYDPKVPDSGYGGTSDGPYELKLSFEADRGEAGLRDTDGTSLDGDGNGEPGGVYSFWFQASDQASTIYVDRVNDSNLNAPDGDGSIGNPFDTISSALSAAKNRIVVPQDAGARINAGETLTIDDGINSDVALTFGSGVGEIPFVGLSAAEIASNIAAAIDAHRGTALAASVNVTVSGRVVKLSNIDALDVEASPTLLKAPNLIRIVGNGGTDGDIDTVGDNVPYLVGSDSSNVALRDGLDLLVPQGATLMIDAGTLIKLRKANIDIGTSSINISRAGSAIQVLGTPQNPVFLRSYHDDSFGGDSDGNGTAMAGDFGGIVIRDDSDLESDGVFLNYINHADIHNGGGKVFVDANEETFTPIHIVDARPTLSFNSIAKSKSAAISASPNSFDDSLGRIGPDVQGNFLADNKIDGLFIRVDLKDGALLDRLTVPGRFDDSDITHVLTQNLIIAGNPGGMETNALGQTVARSAGRLMVDPGVVVKLSKARIEAERGASALIAEGTENRPVIFTSLFDDRYGGSGTFNTDSGVFTTGNPGDWAGLFFGEVSSGSIDHGLISFAGGDSPIEGGSANFNAIEVHQADLRVTNSVIKDNADGNASGVRNGRGANQAAVIYVRGAQPILVSNSIVDNTGTAININANALRFETRVDPGRATGSADRFSQFDDNSGPLVRLNQLDNNSTNGMSVRGELLTTESIWDDTDIVHVLRNEITVDNLHTYGGLTLQSSNTESLVVKLSGTTAGFTATGTPLETIDRIGGTIHVLGTSGHPVVLTSLSDDSIGAGFSPDGTVTKNTNNTANVSSGASGDWRGFKFDEWSNDRNVAVIRERENPITGGKESNGDVNNAQFLGTMAPDEKSADENRRVGFEVNGFISPDDSNDVDLYSFKATAGIGIWIDIDRTNTSLDAIVEVVNSNGTVLARSNRSSDPTGPGNSNANALTQNPLLGGDYYTQNFRDPGLFFVLPGVPGSEGIYFVRVRSAPNGANFAVLDGQSSGKYQLQIRQRQEDEFPGSTIQHSDIRDANTAIDVRGLPSHSLLTGEAGELSSNNNTLGSAQTLVNLLETDMAAIGISGALDSNSDVDWYKFELRHTGVQEIAGFNDSPGTVAVVFDLDYADKALRADTTIAVYDNSGRLVYVSREGNIEDDQQSPSAPESYDLSRGSLGDKDPYIGPIHITPQGANQFYYVAVMSNRQLPTALMGVFQASMSNGENRLTRLEPVNSVTRVVEDHIGLVGYNSYGIPIEPETTQGIFDLTDATTLSNHVVPYQFSDLVTYVITDSSSENGDNLYTASIAEDGGFETRVKPNVGDANNDIQDIVIRSDGAMYGYRNLTSGSGTVGQLVKLDPSTGNIVSSQNDNIPGNGATLNVNLYPTSSAFNRTEQFTTSHEVDAFTFQRSGETGSPAAPVPTYNVYYSVRESDDSSKLYRARQNGDATPANAAGGNPQYGYVGDIQPAGVQNATASWTISNGASPAITTNIRFESKQPGSAGNGIIINVTEIRGGTASAVVTSAGGSTINLQITRTPATGAITGGPTAANIVDAINNNDDASALVTAVITAGSSATTAVSGTPDRTLNGGAGTPLSGRVTGLSYDNFQSNGNLFGVTTAGELLEINPSNGEVVSSQILSDAGGEAFDFQGLALGPQNVDGGMFANVLFAVTKDNWVVAFESDGTFVNAFNGGADYVSTVTGMQGNATGLAFSPLDFNLWHPTTGRASNSGHGINEAPDGSRVPGNEDVSIANPGDFEDRSFAQSNGGASFQFGFEAWQEAPGPNAEGYLTYQTGTNAQLGIRQTQQHADLSSNPDIRDTYNLPGGGLGTLQSNSFSLASAAERDRPTLYFNYFLETENHPGTLAGDDLADPFRDSARVFASRDNGATWELLATNNSQVSEADPSGETGELPGFLSHLSDAGLNAQTPRAKDEQLVQELFDNSGVWRQARVDLSTFAGADDIRLRFDFSTAGTMSDDTLFIGEDVDPASGRKLEGSFGEFRADDRSNRSVNNKFEGFYIDDIIVGFAERGEMVTSATTDSSVTNLDAAGSRTRNNNPTPNPDILKGPYQLEIRRTDEFAGMVADGIRIGTTFDTNDRHVLIADAIASEDYEGRALNSVPWAIPGDIELLGIEIPSLVITPWRVTDTSPFTGSHSLQTGNFSAGSGIIPIPKAVSVYQATLADLGSVSTEAGVIEFAFRVDSPEEHGLRFLIDNVPQNLRAGGDENEVIIDGTLASGDMPYQVVRFPFKSGDHTFTWAFDSTTDPGTTLPNVAFIDDVKLVQGGTGLLADRNRERVQGMFIVDSNIIRNSQTVGINVQPGTPEANGAVPHPGSTIQFPQTDPNRLVPGIVIQNNVIDGTSAIRFAGESNASPNRPVPFGRIINNTLIGTGPSVGTGVNIVDRASPTLMNNIITGFNRGINDATSAGVNVVVRSNYFQGNSVNGGLGTDGIVRAAGTPLFVDAANQNYYLVDTSPALDSSLDELEDRFDYITFKTELGIAISTIDAPARDVYGQLRISSSQIPGGGGSTPFIDRGAVDRSDFEQPFAQLINPIDDLNTLRDDRDPNATVVHLRQPILDNFSILLTDGRGPNAPFEGTGVNPATVNASSVTVRRNNVTLTAGVDFVLGYNEFTGELRLTPFSTLWAPAAVYEIFLDNSLIADNAGNLLKENQANGTTQFTIILPDVPLDFGDATVGLSYATELDKNAARHAIIDGALPRLGKVIDSEPNSAARSGGSDDMTAVVSATSPTGSAIFNITALPGVRGQSIEITATPPSPHAQIAIDIGNGVTLFELVPDGIAPSVGAIAVRYATGDTPDMIATQLTAAITAAMSSPGDSLVVDRPDPLNQALIDVYNLDDEDGVNVGIYNDGTTDYIVFLKPGVNGTTTDNKDVLGFLNPLDQTGTQIPVTVTGSGYVSGWIDFNGDGVFHSTLEKVIDNVWVTDTGNPTIFTVNTPAGTADKVTWARFRISPEGGLQPSGLAVGGEVEDYQVQIMNVPLPVPVNDPLATSTHYTIQEDQTLVTADSPNLIPSLIDNDTFHPLTFTPVTVIVGQDVSNGTLDLDSETGDFVYTPHADFVGIDTFTYRLATQQSAIDLTLSTTVFATVTIEVDPVNDAPLAQDQTIIATEDVIRTVTNAELLINAAAHASPAYPVDAPSAPWDERDQVLQVVALHVDSGTGGGPVTIDSNTPIGAFPVATPRGQILSATFNTTDPSNPFLESFEYRSNLDLNRDNLRTDPGSSIFDEISYTISDDGLSDDPNVLDDGGVDDETGVFDSDRGRLTHTAKVFFDVRPQNDDPIANADSISKDSPRWLAYWAGLTQPAPIPTENVSLTIPFAFLLENDKNAPATAADELADYNDNFLSIPDPGTTLTTTLGGTVTFNSDATFTYVAPLNHYGEDTFVYTAEDQGIDEDGAGNRPVVPRTATSVVTIFVEPVNQIPVAIPRVLNVDEVVEYDGFGNLVNTDRKVYFDSEFLLGLSGSNPVLPGSSDPLLAAPYDESNQALSVVAFSDADESIDVADLTNPDGTGWLPMTTPSGGVLMFYFQDGVFVDGYYEPPVDYNGQFPHEADPDNPLEFFNYVVSDDGTVMLPPLPPGTPYTADPFGKARSLPERVSLKVLQQNDGPYIPSFDTGTTIVDGTLIAYDSNSISLDERDRFGAPTLSFDLYRTVGVEIKPGRPTALDELVSQSLSSVIVQPALDSGGLSRVPDGLMAANPILRPDGLFTIAPVADAFGIAVYDVIVTDSGLSTGANRNVSIRQLTITINPINDAPQASDQQLDNVIEAVERDANGDEISPLPVAQITFTKAQLLRNSVAGVFDASLNAQYNESEQDLRVVAFRVPGVPDDVDGAALGAGEVTTTRTTLNDATLTFTFMDGEFISGTYAPSVDYNRRSPFTADDSFQFKIADGGSVTIPGSDPAVMQDIGSLSSVYATATITTIEQNDPPEFDYLPIVDVLERDDNEETVVKGWATNIMAGPLTARDELQRESVQFTVRTDMSTIPPGLFRLPAKVANNGSLSIYPSPDAVGSATLVIEANDLDPTTSGFVSASRFVTITVNVQPVNDAPRLNPEVVGTSAVSLPDPDLGYTVDSDGTIVYLLREDNTQPGGTPSVFFIPLDKTHATSLGDFTAPGLLDVFTVGPENEADGTTGGSQILELFSLPNTTQRNGKLTKVFDVNNQLIGVNYQPPANYNSAIGENDGFTYSVRDDNVVDGETYALSQNALVPDQRTVSNRVRFRMSPVNDQPEFELSNSKLESSEDSNLVIRNGVAINISGGPRSTALDESTQQVEFSVVPVGFDADEFFVTQPTLTSMGRLTYRPAADVFGDFVFEVKLTDKGPQETATRGDRFESEPQMLTLSIRPINDPPVLQAAAPSLVYSTSEDGFVEILFDGDSGANPGLLDFFVVGPENETSALVGGGQDVSVATPYPVGTTQGGVLTPILNSANAVIGLRYTPKLNFAGTDHFTYTVTDDGVTVALGVDGLPTPDPRTNTNTVTIEVAAINNAPIYEGPLDSDSLEDQGPVTVNNWATGIQAGPDEAIDELAGDGTTPAQTVSFVLRQVSGDAALFAVPPTVTITGNTASLSYTAADNANGDAIFEVILRDDGNPTDPVRGDNNETAPRRFTISVAPVNDAPTFIPGLPVSVDEDSGDYAEIWATSVMPGPANESSQDVSFEVIIPDASRALFETLPTISSTGELQFKPAQNASGSVDIQVRAVDSLDGTSDFVTLSIEIVEQNDAPVAQGDELDTDEDTILVIQSSELTANDVDPDVASNPLESLSVILQSDPATQRNARVTFNAATGEITYDPTDSEELQRLKPGEELVDTFTYSVMDDAGEISDPVMVKVTVKGVNDAPVVKPDVVMLSPEGATQIRPLDNDIDVDGTLNPLSIKVTLQPKQGSLSVEADGTLSYLPFASFEGPDEFRYTVADDLGQQSQQATVTITPNQLPIAPDMDDVIATSKDSTLIDVGAVAIAVVGQLDMESIEMVSEPSNGVATVNSDGTISYTAFDDYLGADSFEFTIRDADGRTSRPATVTIDVVAYRLQNPDPTRFSDVNGDGKVSSLDALMIINRIGLAGTNASSIPVTAADRGPNYYDVSGDDVISVFDALRVINQLMMQVPQTVAGGSGEQLPQLSPIAQTAISQSTTLDEANALDVPQPIEAFDTPQKRVAASFPSSTENDIVELIAQRRETADKSEDDERVRALDEAFADLM